MAFNPDEHITKLPRQTKDKQTNQFKTVYDEYLEVKWRLVWFRDTFPQGTITTEEMCVDLDREVEVEATKWVNGKKESYTKKAKGYARYKATVTDGLGGIATGTKSESAVDFGDYCEKAETGAIGRALAALGFGTQFTGDEFSEKHRIVDSPVKDEVNTTNGNAPVVPGQAATSTTTKPVTQPATSQNKNGATNLVPSNKTHETQKDKIPGDLANIPTPKDLKELATALCVTWEDTLAGAFKNGIEKGKITLEKLLLIGDELKPEHCKIIEAHLNEYAAQPLDIAS